MTRDEWIGHLQPIVLNAVRKHDGKIRVAQLLWWFGLDDFTGEAGENLKTACHRLINSGEIELPRRADGTVDRSTIVLKG